MRHKHICPSCGNIFEDANDDRLIETMDCPGCEAQIKLAHTERRKIGNQLHVRWTCTKCGRPNDGIIRLGPLHSIMITEPEDSHSMAGVPVSQVDLVGGELEQKGKKDK